MARVTVEDCVEKLTNRFELVMVASQRARKISAGSSLMVDRDNDKNPVVALREIAEEKVDLDELKEELVRNHQRIVESDDTEDVIDSMEGEEEWGKISRSNESASAQMYEDADEADMDEDDAEAPSLQDMAGDSAAPLEE